MGRTRAKTRQRMAMAAAAAVAAVDTELTELMEAVPENPPIDVDDDASIVLESVAADVTKMVRTRIAGMMIHIANKSTM